jgi:hypothetical protein
MQKRAPGGAGVPQLGQACSSAVPQDMQNLAVAGFSVPQFVHVCDAIRIKIRHGEAVHACIAHTAGPPADGRF